MFQSKSETQCATCTVVGGKKSSDFPQIISNMAMRYFWRNLFWVSKSSAPSNRHKLFFFLVETWMESCTCRRERVG